LAAAEDAAVLAAGVRCVPIQYPAPAAPMATAAAAAIATVRLIRV
jgi:hypothetical protein